MFKPQCADQHIAGVPERCIVAETTIPSWKQLPSASSVLETAQAVQCQACHRESASNGMSQEDERAARDKESAGYEEWYLSRGYYYDWVERKTILDFLQPKSTDIVLDAGCGTGRLARDIAKICTKVYCADFSPKSIEVLNATASEAGIQNIVSQVHDIKEQFPFTELVDKVVCAQVIQHLPGHEAKVAALRNLRECLRPGGHCVITVYNWNARLFNRSLHQTGTFPNGIDYVRFSADQAKVMFKSAGFDNVHVRGCLNLKGYARNYPIFKYGARLDVSLSRLPVSRITGDFLIITAQKH